MNANTQFNFFPKLLIAILAGSLMLSACAAPPAAAKLPPKTVIPATGDPSLATDVPPSAMPAEETPSSTGTAVTYGALSFVVPPAVASGASGMEFPSFNSEDAAWWQKTPGHIQVTLEDYYVLQGKFHQPQIYLYPAQAYAELVPSAFESLHRLNNILDNTSGSVSADQLPAVPFFNAQQVFASSIQTISFQNGAGLRFLTEYSQYNAPFNNHELFYHFQGLTSDGAFYIIAIFPVTVPVLAETSDTAEVLPPGGIVYPDITDPKADWEGYYTAVTDLLNSSSQETFTPALNHLDSLIKSIQITP